MINKMKIDLHKKMLDYYLDLMIKDENISTIKLLLEEIESLHFVVLKEYINLLPLDNIADRIIDIDDELIIDTDLDDDAKTIDSIINDFDDIEIKIEEELEIEHHITESEKIDELNLENEQIDVEFNQDKIDLKEEIIDYESISEESEQYLSNDIKINIKTEQTEQKTIFESFINGSDEIAPEISEPLIVNNKIEDLHKAFSIADRYFITNELFDNNGNAFAMAIEAINQCASIEQANTILKELNIKYQWDTDSSAFNYFYSIIKQKFNHV